jgi:hypothetical protein
MDNRRVTSIADNPAVEITGQIVTAKFPLKWIMALVAAFTLAGGVPTLASFVNGVSTDQFAKHETAQSVKSEQIDRDMGVCKDSVAEIKRTLADFSAITRMHVATEEARQLTSKIKNSEDRAENFARLLKLNLSRLSETPPRSTCYNLDCKD